jgi:hypothetical protein
MPIIEPHDPNLPHSQGDVLQGVSLFITKESWSEAGGEVKKTAHKLCLIISRPCVVGHKPSAVVAAIEKMADNVPRDVETFEDILGFLTDLRDGTDSPDVFYLGQVPGFDGRFGARLDSLHTIQIPPEAEQRAFIDQKRVGRLHIDFVRDLHTRIFRAFASLGFDDHRWMSTQDLNWMVARGRSEVHDAQSAVEAATAALLSAQARGFRNDGEKRQLEKAVTDAQATLEELRPKVTPFEEELTRRQQPPAAQVEPRSEGA